MTGPAPAIAHVALGSNLGDRRGLIEGAIARLEALPGSRLVARSSIIETEPVGPAGQPAYLNAAIALETTLSPRRLLDALLGIERTMGRVRDPALRWGPRTIDLDILLYADRVVEEDDLTLPHPRLHERAFVLEPLAEIAPDARHPLLDRTIADLLADLRRRA